MSKLGRKFQATIEVDGGKTIVVKNPFTIRFSIKRSVGASMNTMDLDIYNLDANSRNAIFQDMFYQAITKRRHITLQAGYDTLTTIFQGTFYQASSAREGVDIVTSISSRDGGFELENGFIYQTLDNKGLNQKTVLQNLVGGYSKLPNSGVTLGAISPTYAANVFQRPVVLEGNIYDNLKKYSDGQVYVDLEKVYVLKDNEVIAGGIPLLNGDTGLLDTPRRDDSFISINTMFEPRIIMGQQVDLRSTVNPLYNGTYKVVGVQHQGIISDAVGGDLRTTIHMFNPKQFNGSISVVS